MTIKGVAHTSFTVSNLQRSLDFYVKCLHFEILWQRRITDRYFREIVGFPDCIVNAAQLRIPNSDHILELFEYVEPRGVPADVRTNNPGSAHLSLLVDEIQAMYEGLIQFGVRFRSPPIEIDAGANAGGSALYLLDPDGITIELFQPPRPVVGINNGLEGSGTGKR